MQVYFADGQVEEYEDDVSFFGGQGVLHFSRDRRSLVKFYTRQQDQSVPAFLNAQKGRELRIDKLIHEFNPTRDDAYWSSFFAWPEKRVVNITPEKPEIKPYVGFRMRFVGGLKTIENYFLSKSFTKLAAEERGWFIGRVASAIKLTAAAHRLATMGLCYGDFSGKNIMVDPFAGLAVLIDCDSLTVPGVLPPEVDGTPEFRAPELEFLAGQMKIVPNLTSDQHALAILLYRWLLLLHPLYGDRIYDPDPEKDDLLRYGKQATYIEHPIDSSNRASRQILKAQILGPEIAGLFERAFVQGLHNPLQRPQPFEWLQALYHLYDQLIPCAKPECWWHFFVARPGEPLVCSVCKTCVEQPVEIPFVYLLRHRGGSNPNDYFQRGIDASHYIVGWPGRTLHQWHMRPDASPNYTSTLNVPALTPQASFSLDQHTAYWSLKNLSQEQMYYQLPEDTATQQWRAWLPGEHIWLISGMLLQFGPAPFHFRALVHMEQTKKKV